MLHTNDSKDQCESGLCFWVFLPDSNDSKDLVCTRLKIMSRYEKEKQIVRFKKN